MILVTGAAGYIGSMIVHHLYRYYEQPKVIGVDNLSTGYTCPLPSGFTCFHGDVASSKFIGNLIDHHKVKAIIHCAASVVVPQSVADPMAYYHNNVVASHALIQTAIAKRVKSFVFSSSAAVYGQPEMAYNRPLKEDEPTRPISPYGWSKLITEQMLRDAYVAHGMNTVILRYFNVAGADPLMQTGQVSPSATHLIMQATRAALGLGSLVVNGDGRAVRDYVHVADLAKAHSRALEWNAQHCGCLTLNVGSGHGHSVNQVLDEVANQLSHRFTYTTAPPREGDPSYIVASIRAIKDKFNWEPQFGLADIVEHALRWELNQETAKKLPHR